MTSLPLPRRPLTPALLLDAVEHMNKVLSEDDAREEAILAEVDIRPTTILEQLDASVWFSAHRPEYTLLDSWVHRTEVRVAVCLKAPAVGQEPMTDVFRRVAGEPSRYEWIASER
jgi:hypothetical protein